MTMDENMLLGIDTTHVPCVNSWWPHGRQFFSNDMSLLYTGNPPFIMGLVHHKCPGCQLCEKFHIQRVIHILQISDRRQSKTFKLHCLKPWMKWDSFRFGGRQPSVMLLISWCIPDMKIVRRVEHRISTDGHGCATCATFNKLSAEHCVYNWPCITDAVQPLPVSHLLVQDKACNLQIYVFVFTMDTHGHIYWR